MRAHAIRLGLLVVACAGSPPGGPARPGGGPSQDTSGVAFTAAIVSPNGDTFVLAGGDLRLDADFELAGSPVLPERVRWETSVFLGEGNPLDVALVAGVHTIRVTATLDGRTATDSVTVTAGDIAVRILQPDDKEASEVGTPLRFLGAAEVPGPIELVSGGAGAGQRTATFTWSSSLDGQLAATSDFQYDALSIGSHRLTLTVADDQAGGTGRTGAATLDLVVRPPNVAPSVDIVSPVCPLDLEVGAEVILTGTVTDPDPGDAAIGGAWADSLDGSWTTGNTLVLAGVMLGKHQLVFSATDAAGESDAAVCDVFVVPVGGSRADLFADSAALNDVLAGGDTNIRFIGNDGGVTFVGNDEGLTVFGGAGAPVTYDAAELGVDTGGLRVNAVAVAGTSAFVATESGLAACAYSAAALSGCVEIWAADAVAVAASGDPSSSALLAAASRDGLWLASQQGTAFGEATTLSPDNSNLPSAQIADVLWIGPALYVATENGLCVAESPGDSLANPDGATFCTSILDRDNTVLPDGSIRSLAAAGGLLYIGTDDGLAALDVATGSMRLVDLGFGGEPVNDVAIDGDGVLWVATDRGLTRVDGSAVTQLTGSDWGSAGDPGVQSIFVDSGCVKWLGTEAGIVRYNGA
jgi:hypothetical protein